MSNKIQLKSIQPEQPSAAGRNAPVWIVTYSIRMFSTDVEVDIAVSKDASEMITANEASGLAWKALSEMLNGLCMETEQNRSEHGKLAL